LRACVSCAGEEGVELNGRLQCQLMEDTVLNNMMEMNLLIWKMNQGDFKQAYLTLHKSKVML